LKHPEVTQLDLLRQAIFGLDVGLAQTAREALTKVDTPMATPLISDALQVPMNATERNALIDTLDRLGDKSPVARWLAGVHRGLAARTSKLDPSAWSAGASYPAPPPDEGMVWTAEDKARSADAHPEDPQAQLGLADASLTLATDAPDTYLTNQRLARRLARASYEDAYAAGKRAHDLGATGWPVESILTLSAYYTDRVEEAYEHAAKAMDTLPEGDGSWRTMAVVTIFAESRYKAIKAAVKEKKPWSPQWLADLHAAYNVLLNHPLGTVAQVVWHHDFLVWLGADNRALQVLQQGLARFKDSIALHERLRDRLIKTRGPDELEATYKKLLEESDDPDHLLPFAADASVAAAEQYRRTQKYEKALDAYGHGLDLYARWLKAAPEAEEGAKTPVALALAGRARVAYQVEEPELALTDILASFEKDPAAAGTRDRMGITPGETGQMLLARLKALGRQDLAHKLETALSKLDPELLVSDRGLEPGR
jgi:tetratricopeptide (TPR) repeat protein